MMWATDCCPETPGFEPARDIIGVDHGKSQDTHICWVQGVLKPFIGNDFSWRFE